jgi:hypothetical protein
MASYESRIEITAPAATVSSLLLNLSNWTSWTRTVDEATLLGKTTVEPGTRVRTRQPYLPVSIWTVDVADERAFEWNNLRHGLRTVARHDISETDGGALVTAKIVQEGLLARPVELVYGRVIRRHLQQMTEDLKHAAESAAGAEPLDLDVGRGDPSTGQQLRANFGKNG